MVANTKQSYDVTIECMIMGTTTKSTNSLDLKNPYFRYTGVQPPPPPGQDNQSPSEAYWSQVDMQGARQVSIDAGGLFSVCQELKRNLFCWLNEGHFWFALICFDIHSFIVENTKSRMKFALFLFLGKSIFYHLYLVLYLIIKLIWVCMFVGGRLQHLRDLGEWFSMYVNSQLSVYRLDCQFECFLFDYFWPTYIFVY